MNKVTTLAEYDNRYPTVPLGRWRENVVDAVAKIADRTHQKANWLRDDRPAWENPNEIINVLFDDSLFELFLTDCYFNFSESQREAAQSLLSKLHYFLDDAPQSLDPAETLDDPQWEEIRIAARHFVLRFSS